MNPITELKNDLNGIELLHDWLGTGDPVHPVVSGFRAKICIACPLNVHPGWWDRNLKFPVARIIKAEMELKAGLKLTVPNEEKLGVCKVCGCCNALAVHVPIVHLKAHTPADLLPKFPDVCWKKREILASS